MRRVSESVNDGALDDARAPQAVLSAALAQQLGIAAGETVRVTQGNARASAKLVAAIDDSLPANVVRVAAGHARR